MTPRTPLTAPESSPGYAERIANVWASLCSLGRARPALPSGTVERHGATRCAGLDRLAILMAALAILGAAPAAHAQWAVIDVGAIAQLMQEVQQMQQALQTAQNQLNQAKSEYNSITGLRGMQNLLSGINRNYLPSTWSQLPTALASPIQSQIGANAVLTASQIAALSPAEQQQLNAARGNAALLQVAAQQAYSTTSSRFASVQQLISAIATATDQKGILELQARIQAEQGMLQTDNTKLSVLYQAAQAQEWARRQTAQEQVVAGIGNLRTLPALRLP
jgi:type IV secretion system protein VirB5